MNSNALVKHIRTNLLNTRKSVLKVDGHSMDPLIRNGDYIIIVTIDHPISIGSVYLIQYYDQLLVHRCIQTECCYICFKGDNSLRIERVSRDCIIGQATHYIRDNKRYIIPFVGNDIVNLSIAVNREWKLNRLDWQQVQESKSYLLLRTKLELLSKNPK